MCAKKKIPYHVLAVPQLLECEADAATANDDGRCDLGRCCHRDLRAKPGPARFCREASGAAGGRRELRSLLRNSEHRVNARGDARAAGGRTRWPAGWDRCRLAVLVTRRARSVRRANEQKSDHTHKNAYRTSPEQYAIVPFAGERKICIAIQDDSSVVTDRAFGAARRGTRTAQLVGLWGRRVRRSSDVDRELLQSQKTLATGGL